MKRIHSFACILVLLLLLAVPAFAAPSAEISATITDVQEDENGILFALKIQMLAPSEPYASLDFSLVCSNYEQLAIVDKSAAGDRSSLDIVFTTDYGSAYHKGRINSETGAISYLIGIFSPAGGNAITGATDVCTVMLRYTGSEQATISLEGLKLVYNDENGAVTAVRDFPSMELEVDAQMLVNADSEIEIDNDETPLASLEPPIEPDGISPLTVAIIAVGALLVLAVVLLLRRNRMLAKQLAAHGAKSEESNQGSD